MPTIRELREDEEVRPASRASRVRALRDDERVEKDPGVIGQIVQGLSEHARQFNMGVMDNIGMANVVAGGASTERPTDMSQAAARMTGNAAGFAAAILAPILRGPQVAGAMRAPVVVSGGQEAAAAGGAMRSASPGVRPAVGSFVDDVTQTALRNPGTFWGLEMGSAAAAGAVGGAVAQEVDSPASRLVAEMTAGLAVAGAAPLASRALDLSPMWQGAKSAVSAFRRPAAESAASRRRAGARIRRADPEITGALNRAQSADVLEEAPLTFGELSESPGILSLERSVADAAEELTQARQQRFAEVNRVISEALTTAGDSPGVTPDPQAARAYLGTLVDERIRIARVAVDEELNRLGQGLDSPTANVMARRELDRAYSSALAQERQLYEVPDMDVQAAVTHSMDAYQSVLRNAMEDRVALARLQDRLPDNVTRFFGRLVQDAPGKMRFRAGDFARRPPTARELGSLRSDVLDEIRLERSKDAPDRRKIGMLDSLQDGILADLNVIEGTSEALQVARGFSKDMNQRFRQGEIGRILGFERTGEGRIPDTLTLESLLGRRGARGAEAARSLMTAVERSGDPVAMQQIVEDYITNEFLRTARTGGEFDARKGRNYIDNARRAVLDNFPELGRRLEQAVRTGDARVAAESMLKPSQSAAGILLGAPPGTEIGRLLSSADPGRGARELVQLMEQDSTGQALPSLRRSAMDWLLGTSQQGGNSRMSVDAEDIPFVSGTQLRRALDRPRVMQVLGEILTPEQVSRVEKIANTARALDIGRRADPSPEGVIKDREAMLVNFIRRFGAARLGSEVTSMTGGRSNIQIPGMVIEVSDKLREKGIDPARTLIIDAVNAESDQLLRALATEAPPQGSRRARFINQQLNAWAVSAAAQYGLSLESPANEGAPNVRHRPDSDIPAVIPR